MSFEVLALKYRPQTFEEIVGQEHITRVLKKAAQLGRISHAYLFSGPKGCGKTSTARILAKVVNCERPRDGEPCNACPPCLAVIRGNNLDVMEIDGATHTGVGEVRDLQESIGYTPSQHANKVYIIDEVHMLSASAFNALLKTLEEPPPHVYFIFATTAPHKIPETIKSRCQRHHFKRLRVGEISAQLEKICKAEGVDYEPEALRLIASKAEGSMRDGESLLDQCITASSGEVGTANVRNILGLLDQEMVFSFLEVMGRKDPGAVLRKLDTVVDEGVDVVELSSALLEGFRDLMMLSVPEDLSGLLIRSADEVDRLRRLVDSYELGDLVTIVERLCNLVPRLKTAADPRILLESALVDLTLLDRQADIRELIGKLEGSGGRGRDGGGGRSGGKSRGSAILPSEVSDDSVDPKREDSPRGSAAKVKSVPREKEREVGGGGTKHMDSSLENLWHKFVTEVRQKKVSLGVCLISGRPVRIDEGTIFVRFPKAFYVQRRQVEEALGTRFLESVTKKVFGENLKIVCLDEGEEQGVQPSDATSEGDDGLENLPLTKKILDDFDGEIVQR